MIKRTCCSRFSLHIFVHLNFFWTQFKNLHLRGPCSLRLCISRPYCTLTAQIYMFAHWTKNVAHQRTSTGLPLTLSPVLPTFATCTTHISAQFTMRWFPSTYLLTSRAGTIYLLQRNAQMTAMQKKRSLRTMGQSKNMNPTSCSRRYWMTPSLNWRVEGHLN